MVQHITVFCPHGKQISTCECPSPLKAVVVRPVCSLDCIDPRSGGSEASESPSTQQATAIGSAEPRTDRPRSRIAALQALKSDWILLNEYLATSEDTEIFEPLELVLNSLCELAAIRLDSVDPRTRITAEGRVEDALRGSYADQIHAIREDGEGTPLQ